MFRAFRTEWYEQKLKKLSRPEYDRVLAFEQHLKIEPYSGRPLGYSFFREKKFDGKRLLFLVYEEQKAVFFITITDKKAQQQDIDAIKAHLDQYKEELQRKAGLIFLLFFLPIHP